MQTIVLRDEIRFAHSHPMTVHTLADLRSRDVLDAGHSKPARLAVIGQPIKHSASPRMHQPALDEAGIDARYIALEVEPSRVGEAFERMQALDFIGCNVTVPHKFDALETCDEIDDAAQAMGAVNTVRFDEDAIRGSNTDGYGFAQAVREALDFGLRDQSILIAGAGGGAGSAIAAYCALSGAARIILANRTLSKIEALAEKLKAQGADVTAIALNDTSLPSLARDCDLLVNTSSLGLKASDPSPLPETCFTNSQSVFDSIYDPANTRFLQLAQAAGARTANGQNMLLLQGVQAFRFWFPDTSPEAAMRRGLGG